MSRSNAAKSRIDKSGKAVSAPTPAIMHEIVPGKYNDQDWACMLDNDEEDEFVSSIVEEISSLALDAVYQNYLEKQVVPYTVMQAKDALLQIVQWQFLTRDSGELNVDLDANWMEDEEPPTAVTDCWAQGAVPKCETVVNSACSSPVHQDEEPDQLIDNECMKIDDTNNNKTEANEETSIVIEESIMVEPTITHKMSTIRKKKIKKRYSGPLKSPRTKQFIESLDQTEMQNFLEEQNHPSTPKTPETELFHMPNSCHSIIKLQAGRPPGNRDVLYDQAGNVVSISKINPETLPNHKVKTGFKVVDPQVEAAQARLEAMRTGRKLKPAHTQSTSILSSNKYVPVVSAEKKQQVLDTKKSKDNVTSLLPLLMESMDLSPGVVVCERNRVRVGPKTREINLPINSKTKRSLQPVKLQKLLDPITLSDIIGNQSPIIKPLTESPTIPAILPHLPSQRA